MSKPKGIFDSFENLDKIQPQAIANWLNPAPPALYLENYLANKLLYPQSLPLSNQDLKIELAILKEALKINSPQSGRKTNPFLGDSPFLNLNLKKILIPSHFLNFVPDLTAIVLCFIDGLLLERKKEKEFQDIWTVLVTGDLDEVVGSVILPKFESQTGNLKLDLLGKSYIVKAGDLSVIPCDRQKCQILFKSTQGKILGKNDLLIEVYGGRLGICVDGRLS